MTTKPPSQPVTETPVGSVPGTYLRPRPSGLVHSLEWVDRDGGGRPERDVLIFRCGKESRRERVTADFPPGAARCPVCLAAPLSDDPAHTEGRDV